MRVQVTKTFPARLEAIPQITTFLRDLFEEWQLSQNNAYDLTLTIDEACTNIAEHGTEENQTGEIKIVLTRVFSTIHIRIIDTGKSFSPEKVPLPDIRKNLSGERRGGFGVYLIKKLTDRLRYFPRKNYNELILIKKLDRI